MKMISLDDIIKYCDNERTAYRANSCGAACTALRRVAEFAKEYAIETEPDNGWISVDDRLPEPYESVLVFGNSNDIVTYRVDYLDDYDKWFRTFYVTHWRPLPEPPKGVNC